MQDQAFLGTEAALAVPDHDGGGVEEYIATQWLREDRKQMAKCLALPTDKVRLTLGGVGGATNGAVTTECGGRFGRRRIGWSTRGGGGPRSAG